MSAYTHAICLPCWRNRNGDRIPLALSDDGPTVCCWCRQPTADGIYLASDERLLCAGQHGRH